MLLIKAMPIGNKTKIYLFLYKVFDSDDIIKLMT